MATIKNTIAGAAVLIASGAAAFETPTMGWSSWNTYRVDISDELICRQADALAGSKLKDAGYLYINIDDGFFGGRAADGSLLTHPVRFPDGLKPVVDHIHSLGLKAGIYSDAGRNTCGNFWDNDSAGVGVGLYGHDEADARYYFRDLGFDFIKIDFCGGDAKQNSEGLALDERERYTAIRRAIDATGRADVRVNICRWAFPGTWVRSVGSSWRISGDISPHWGSIKRIIAANSYLSAYAGEGKFNDMDMLEIGRGLSDAEERTHFGMWCIMCSPLMIGCDLTAIPEKSLDLITNPELIDLNRDPLGLQAKVVAADSGVTLFVKDLESLRGLRRAVAIYNPTDSPRTFTLRPADVELAGRVKARDLFSRSDLGEIAPGENMEITVGAHDTAILRLEGERRLEPQVYEAENAWLERFQKLGKSPALGHAIYTPDSACSGGAKVEWLGNHPDNRLEWRDVWSDNGGSYSLTLDFLGEDPSSVFVSVNGAEPTELVLDSSKGPASAVVTLAPGFNTVSLANPARWVPAIDRMILVPDASLPAGKLSEN